MKNKTPTLAVALTLAAALVGLLLSSCASGGQPAPAPSATAPSPPTATGPILSDEQREQVSAAFTEYLQSPVRLLVFGRASGCASCLANQQLVQEVAAGSELVSAQAFDLDADSGTASEYAIDKVPAIAIEGEQDDGIRFFGLPSGLEFPTFLNTIIDVSRGDIRLSDHTLQWLESVRKPVHIEVFFSPTCPACTEVVTLAHQFALASDLIRADAINIREFDALYQSYDPQGTPATLVNGTTLIEGNMSEQEFLQNLLTIVQ